LKEQIILKLTNEYSAIKLRTEMHTQTHVRSKRWANTYETEKVAVALREQIMTIQSSLIL